MSGVQRTTRPEQCNTTSVGVPMASAGMAMVKLTMLPTGSAVANWNKTPLAEMFSVTAARSPPAVLMVIGTQSGKRTAARSSTEGSVATATVVSMHLIIDISPGNGNTLKRPGIFLKQYRGHQPSLLRSTGFPLIGPNPIRRVYREASLSLLPAPLFYIPTSNTAKVVEVGHPQR